MKNKLVGKNVDDVAGLYYDLIKNGFKVENVGSDKSGTHVFLHDEEEKDPTSIVESWVGKEAPVLTRSLVEQRKTVSSEYEARRTQWEAEARVKAAEEGGESPSVAVQPLPAISGSKQTLFSKIFRKLW